MTPTYYLVLSAALFTIGSYSGLVQFHPTHSLTPTIGPSATQRSSSCRLSFR